MGGSLGVALFGAIFASRLATELASLPGDVAARLSGGGVNVSPADVHALTPAVRHDFLLAFVDALQPVFLVGAGLTAVAFVLSLALQGGPAARDDGGRAAVPPPRPVPSVVVTAEPPPAPAPAPARG